MRFTLHYRGPLKANASPADKHELRRHFHKQLRRLWAEEPLSRFTDFLQPGPGTVGSIFATTPANGFLFAHIVCEQLATVAELDILLQWPQPPGAIISQGGDIDNRLKT